MEFLLANLDKIVAIGGGLGVAAFLIFRKGGNSNENDLTPIVLRHKRHTDGIIRGTKSIL